MTETLQQQQATCECGAAQFEVGAAPAVRFFCHCTICQAYNDKPFADVTVLRAKYVEVNDTSQIAFKKYRPPPNINRGLCKTCGKPAIEFFGFGPAKLALLPSINFKRKELLPPPAIHIFYHRRLGDAADDLPKYTGYLRSQMAVSGLFMRLFRGSGG
ncbi:GFA family protein [Polyangium jinanense]|uniref:GFA family protein n=1 Tax=Polyangium jinanense TaxID=2829994 RepID=A0A9X3XGH4_9BACT|nr:GFA family protein [Polyangium jinanense]MDC3962743.1 GFA family protein [Polyangium jinanense]MDC3989592.1 GFA family protein [Polyangium jinanense]